MKSWIMSEWSGRAENSAELVFEGWRELLEPKRGQAGRQTSNEGSIGAAMVCTVHIHRFYFILKSFICLP